MQTGIGSAYIIKGFSTSHFHENSTPLIGVLEIAFLKIPDKTMIRNIIMSSHSFYFGPRADILDEKSWTRVRFQPLTYGMASRHH